MKTPVLFFIILIMISSNHCFADIQNEVITQDAVGTIGYVDNFYFTVVLKTDFGSTGEDEIGFAKTEDLQLPPMHHWRDVTPGLAVRVTYEETRSTERSTVDGVETQLAAVLERKAVKLAIGQKLKRKGLVS